MTFVERAPAAVVGIDVSKETLAVFEAARQQLGTVKNTSAAVRKLIAGLPPGTLVIFEPTGGYEALLAAQLAAHGIACHRADTLKVKAFLRSFGRLAKTDALDAKALAEYGTERWKQLALYQPADKRQAKLAALVARRQDLMALKTAETNRSKAPGNPIIAKSCKTVIACLGRQIETIDKEVDALIAASQSLARRAKIYSSLPGVGPRTAIALLATLPELGTLTRRQAASLAGLAPHPRDSGTFKGYRKMRGGRPQVRTNLFMAALVGARVPGPLHTFYQRL
ncbi:IS110 family transposase, partial [Labrenzia sp. R4_2]|uniref:IS110 family transposase n=1 Tax=Labrenzia sp. R4_2 TaxID=2821107 RepID=UPI001AD96097